MSFDEDGGLAYVSLKNVATSNHSSHAYLPIYTLEVVGRAFQIGDTVKLHDSPGIFYRVIGIFGDRLWLTSEKGENPITVWKAKVQHR